MHRRTCWTHLRALAAMRLPLHGQAALVSRAKDSIGSFGLSEAHATLCAVTALDVDGDKLHMLMHNAALYGADVAARITPVCGDYFAFAQETENADLFDA